MGALLLAMMLPCPTADAVSPGEQAVAADQSGAHARAARLFERAFACRPNPEMALNAGLEWQKVERCDRAAVWLERATETHPASEYIASHREEKEAETGWIAWTTTGGGDGVGLAEVRRTVPQPTSRTRQRATKPTRSATRRTTMETIRRCRAMATLSRGCRSGWPIRST